MSIPRISSKELHAWITGPGPKPSIVDVRDSDYFGGHIKGSRNVPSHRFARDLADLQRATQDSETVVFYCQLSQQRGPSCAKKFASVVKDHQKVYVLDGGFGGWATKFGKDPELTEDFISELYN